MKSVIFPLHRLFGIIVAKTSCGICVYYFLTIFTFKKSWKKYFITVIIVIIHSFTHSLFAQSEHM